MFLVLAETNDTSYSLSKSKLVLKYTSPYPVAFSPRSQDKIYLWKSAHIEDREQITVPFRIANNETRKSM